MNETALEISAGLGTGVDIRPGYLPDALPLGDQKFDLICMFDVLEHVAEDEASLAVISAPSRPRGRRCDYRAGLRRLVRAA